MGKLRKMAQSRPLAELFGLSCVEERESRGGRGSLCGPRVV